MPVKTASLYVQGFPDRMPSIEAEVDRKSA
jgi:hypothetical protein